ncbi:MAG: 16S rRNA (cytosine(1402)-N(4))-methyltransferase RsmH [Planctomycetota bacterium]|nr:MAG: 16S rRNA (cytosine(1402)-N(4))-methyltransferase RsmH [Planctomycetota bacterium]
MATLTRWCGILADAQNDSDPAIHVSVLLSEALGWLRPQIGQVFVDGTLGAGGHARAIAERVQPGGQVIALDRDPAAIARASKALAGLPIRFAQANFCDLAEVLDMLGIAKVDGVLLDLGLSSDQLADRERGFSFNSEGPLDLRFDVEEGEPAWRLLARLHEDHLANLIYELGEERLSRRIARKIVERRTTQPVHTAIELADLVRSCYPASARRDRIDPATRTFQALRIAVNQELKSLEIALRRTPDLLAIGGRFAVISFHSLEDRRVKEAFRGDPRLKELTRKPIVAGEEELTRNPRARSAKMRVGERVALGEDAPLPPTDAVARRGRKRR